MLTAAATAFGHAAGTAFGPAAGTAFGHAAGTAFGHAAGTAFGHAAGMAAPTWPGVLARWELDPAVVAAVAGAAVAYAAGCRVSGRPERGAGPERPPERGTGPERPPERGAGPERPPERGTGPGPGPPAPTARRWAFGAGLAVTVVALCSPVATYADALLSVHMVQHLLLTLVAAPLLVAGRPVTVVTAWMSPDRRRRLLRLRRSPLVAGLGHPLLAWLAFAAVGWVAHFSSLYDLALEHAWTHALEHALFLGSALLFWRVVLGAATRWRLSHPLRLLFLAVAMPQATFLALAIYSSSRPLYRHYVEAGRSWGPSPLADQRLAGGIMWIAGDFVLLGAVLVTAGAWAAHEQRVTTRREALEDAAAAAARPPAALT